MALPAFLLHKFDPFDFTGITGYPYDMPAFYVQNEYLPKFSRKEYEDPAQHLQEFHERMEQRGIIHEDVKMNFLLFSKYLLLLFCISVNLPQFYKNGYI